MTTRFTWSNWAGASVIRTLSTPVCGPVSLSLFEHPTTAPPASNPIRASRTANLPRIVFLLLWVSQPGREIAGLSGPSWRRGTSGPRSRPGHGEASFLPDQCQREYHVVPRREDFYK